MSGDPDQDYFADGVVEDITTDLARLRWLFVIARNTSFTYRDQPHDVRQVGRELGVRYVLEGSVRRAGEPGADHQPADRCRERRASVGRTLRRRARRHLRPAGPGRRGRRRLARPRLEQAEFERATRKPTESLDAYDYYLRGMAGFHRFSHADNLAAAALFARTIELDPGFAPAYGMAARCYLQRKAFGWAGISEAEVADAERLARRAAELGREDAVALGAAAGALLAVVGEVEEGAALIDRAIRLNPNLAWLWNYSAYARLYLGQPETAIEHAERAMRLSPHDPQIFGMQAAIAFGHFFAGRYEAATAWAETAMRERPTFFVAVCVAAASAALAGKMVEATRAMGRLRRLNPALRLSNLEDLLPFRRAEDLARWADGLRGAGLPE